MSLQSVHEIIRTAEQNYLQGTTKLGEYVDWSMHDTIERVDAYLNSKHTSGATDSLNREKPFFNIVTAATNIWYRATDIDRKDIRFVPTKQSDLVRAFVANVLLQNWMNTSRFGQFLNLWGRTLARYGSAIVKFVEKDGELIPSVIPWNRFIADPVQFDALPKIEKFYKTPAQLRQMKEYDSEVVSRLIEAHRSTRKTLDGFQKDNQSEFIELYEVHGQMDSRLLQNNPDENIDDSEITYRQQMHVVSYVQGENSKYDDFTLFKGPEAKDPYMITHLIEEDGRTLSIGAVEYLFDAQWMQNHTIKNMKDTLDLASKLVFQTADAHFVGRNVLSAIETGDVLIHTVDMPLTRIANDKPDITALQNFGTMWRNMASELTSTPDALRGNTLPSGTPYSLGAYLGTQANSLFELMTENKGLHLEDIIRTYVIPHLKKKLNNKEEIVGILDDAGVSEIDKLFVPKKAIQDFNSRAVEEIIAGNIPSPYAKDMEEQKVSSELSLMGNKRFFTPDELSEKTWKEIFDDFNWDSVRVEVTNESVDKGVVLQTLSTVLQAVASNPMILQDPNAKAVFGAILAETGKISPIQLTSSSPTLTPTKTEGLETISNVTS